MILAYRGQITVDAELYSERNRSGAVRGRRRSLNEIQAAILLVALVVYFRWYYLGGRGCQ